LTADALKFLSELHTRFDKTRVELLQARLSRQFDLDNGGKMQFPVGDHEGEWKVAEIPEDLRKRQVEITGPPERKMVINALNSGSDVYMADFEDSLSPTWSNVVEGQINLMEANRGTIEFKNPDGSVRKLKDKTAQLFVRTRGWHLTEHHLCVDGTPIAGALVDFGLHFFHNIHHRLSTGSATYFYLPKMEHALECRLWNDVFKFAEEYLKVPQGSIRVTIMVETLPAAVEMEAMLYELRDYACAMNAGRWDYIFSAIKRFKESKEAVMPDRGQVTMLVPFMKNYSDLIVRVCHRHSAMAIGGMSAFIPSRRDPEVNKVAMEKVSKDKVREANDGFDGTWVAHPDLVKLARDIFADALPGKDNQIEKIPRPEKFPIEEITTFTVEGGKVTEAGVRVNISIGLQYINKWLGGLGAVAINNLMEDAATAEISRAQLWQWRHHGVTMEDGVVLTTQILKKFIQEELEKLGGASCEQYGKAVFILEQMSLSADFEEFLTVPSYQHLVYES